MASVPERRRALCARVERARRSRRKGLENGKNTRAKRLLDTRSRGERATDARRSCAMRLCSGQSTPSLFGSFKSRFKSPLHVHPIRTVIAWRMREKCPARKVRQCTRSVVTVTDEKRTSTKRLSSCWADHRLGPSPESAWCPRRPNSSGSLGFPLLERARRLGRRNLHGLGFLPLIRQPDSATDRRRSQNLRSKPGRWLASTRAGAG